MSGIYSLLSGAQAQQRRLETTSNNLANVNTNGYKADDAVFRQHLDQAVGVDLESEEELFNHNEFLTPFSLGSATYAQTDDVLVRLSTGGYQHTEKPFDLAIEGEGFFVVETPYGKRYTKNGEFHKNNEGYLTTSQGHLVLGKSGPLFVEGEQVVFTSDGSLEVDQNIRDTLQIVRFDEASKLRKVGNSYFIPENHTQNPQEISAVNFVLLQGKLEKSNVNSVDEMVNLITVNRAYQATHNAIKSLDEIDAKSISMGG